MNQEAVRFEVKLAVYISLLVVFAMWTFHGTTGNLFVWDSEHYLYFYEDHISSLNLENIKWMATSLEFFNWHPLTWFSWAVDYQLYGGLDPWGYHFSNNLLHGINSAVVFVLILMIFGLVDPASKEFAIRKDTHSLIAAFLAALLFVVHPQHVESVAWVAERKDLLCQLFLLLSLLSYVKYVTCKSASTTRWYLITLSLFFLAVLSKPMAVTFPAVLLLVDVYPLRRTALTRPMINSISQRSLFRLIIEKIPFFLLSFVLILATLIAQESAVAELPLMMRVVNAVHSVIFYLEKFILPLQLSPHYPYFVVVGGNNALEALLVFSIFLGITLAAMLAWRKQKQGWMIAWLFYLGTLSPVLGLIQVGGQGAADRYTYFPTLPLYILAAGGILSVLQSGKTFRKLMLLLTVTTVVFLFTFQTRQQIGVWQSKFSLWTQAVNINPNHVYARDNLGVAYMNIEDYESAAIQFEASGEITSTPTAMLAWRGVTYMHLGRYEDSLVDHVNLGVASETKPDLKVDSNCVQYNIGWNYAQLEMYPEATELFARVDKESNIGHDASLWVDELKRVQLQDHEGALSEELPGICEKLIPSRVLTLRVSKLVSSVR